MAQPDLLKAIADFQRGIDELVATDPRVIAERMVRTSRLLTTVVTGSSQEDLRGYLEHARHFAKSAADQDRVRDGLLVATTGRYEALARTFYIAGLTAAAQVDAIESYFAVKGWH